ncbi:transporter [Salinisphaera sp. RV14]|uniref:transporter n=1 Tax=unclassified Salinisphaera TaxID=2649847 RepID=UPI003F830877
MSRRTINRAAICAGLALTLAQASAGALAAGASRQSLDDALFTGPLAAPNATSLPQGHWDIEPYVLDSIQHGHYDNNWHSRNTPNVHALRSVSLLEYGLTNRLLVAVLPEFGYNVVEHGADSQGIRLGDTKLRFQYMLHAFHEGSWLPTTALAFSEVFPTGKYDGLGDHPANGLGSGLLTSTLGLFTQDYFWMPNGRILRSRLDLTYTIPDDNASVNGVSVYGTGRGFNGTVDAGNTFSADLAFEYSMTRHWAPAVDVIYSHSGGDSVRGVQASNGLVTSVNTNANASEAVDVAPAIEYNWNSHYGVIVGADVVVAGRNTGDAVTPQAAFNIYY